MKILANTYSVCPICVKKIKATISEEKNRVYLNKKCGEHGNFKILLSNHAYYYKELKRYYNFFTLQHSYPSKKRVYNLFLTLDCNLMCPICCISSPQKTKKLSFRDIKKLLLRFRNTQICLYGGEPTVRKDLSEIIKLIKTTNNEPILYTNGIKIANYNYLKKLKKAGIHDVRLQFDGFNDRIYKKLRGTKMLSVKLKALSNLRKLDIPTGLEVTVSKSINEDQMNKILQYALGYDFIRAIAFFPHRCLGHAKFQRNRSLIADDLISHLEEQTKGLISQKKILQFQKLMFSVNYLLSREDCIYNQYFLLIKSKKGFKPLDLDCVKDLKLSKNKIYLMFQLLKYSNSDIFLNGILIYLKKLFGKSINLTTLSRKMLLIGIKEPCDLYTFDYNIAETCPGGNISLERGIVASSAIDNIIRERNQLKSRT